MRHDADKAALAPQMLEVRSSTEEGTIEGEGEGSACEPEHPAALDIELDLQARHLELRDRCRKALPVLVEQLNGLVVTCRGLHRPLREPPRPPCRSRTSSIRSIA